MDVIYAIKKKHLYDDNIVHYRQSLLITSVADKYSRYVFCRCFPTLHINTKVKACTVDSTALSEYFRLANILHNA